MCPAEEILPFTHKTTGYVIFTTCKLFVCSERNYLYAAPSKK